MMSNTESKKNRGLLIVFSGPSGVGKGSIIRPFMQQHPDVRLSVSATTRAPRTGEEDGVNYFFKTKEEFEGLIEAGEMLEHALYNGNYYGTPREAVERMLDDGLDVVLEIEVQGAQLVRRRFADCVSVFVMPPSFQELANRLTGRQTESPEVIERRLAIAKREIDLAYEYDFILMNDKIDDAIHKLGIIIEAAKCTPKYMRDFIDEVNEHA